MARSSTDRFLEIMNERNERIAAAEAEPYVVVGVDEVREQRMREYREKWGPTLAAKAHPSKRVHKARFVGVGSMGRGPGQDQT